MSGLPNKKTDETPVTLDRQVLPLDPMGIDPEAICLSGEHIWLAEEYGPSLLKFNRQGQLVTRYVPQDSFPKGKRPPSVKEILPPQLLTRKLNRGFEGMTCLAGKIYAAIQSPLPADGKNILIVEFDPYEERVTRSFYYSLESMDADKIGDLAHHNGKLLVLEQNSKIGPESFHRIYEIDPNEPPQLGVAKKRLFLDLVKAGYDFADKVEGMIMVDRSHIAIINDNDFGLVGTVDPATSAAVIDPKKKTRLALIKID
jgi:3-phytase